jgi:hypothetical protein
MSEPKEPFRHVIQGKLELKREDGGAALIGTLRDDQSPPEGVLDGMFVRVQSWDESCKHEKMAGIKDKVVRVTIEELLPFTIWTAAYSPFIMGGDVNAPMGTTVYVGEREDLGKGFFGHVVSSPLTGATYVVEATTGAIIGENLADVREDIEVGERDVMVKQVADAKTLVSRVRMREPDEFWKAMAKAR